MINFDNPKVGTEFEEAFGKPASSLTLRQLWWLVKFGKHVRGRCRSNAALNNYLRRNFPHAKFEEVTKTNATGERYPGLEISINGVAEGGDNDSET